MVSNSWDRCCWPIEYLISRSNGPLVYRKHHKTHSMCELYVSRLLLFKILFNLKIYLMFLKKFVKQTLIHLKAEKKWQGRAVSVIVQVLFLESFGNLTPEGTTH